MTVSLHEMKALWAFTEIRSERTTRFYHDSRVPILQSRLKNLVFAVVTMQDRDILAEMWEEARGKFLSMYIAGVTGFALEYWSSTQLGEILAMSQMDPAEQVFFVSMLTYAKLPRPVGPSAETDPRMVADRSVLSGRELEAGDPIIVGLFNRQQVLIDGYGRGVRFIQCAEASDRIPVLVPIASDATQ
jgi:hypothetical protein